MIVCAIVGFVKGFCTPKSTRFESAVFMSKKYALASFQLYSSFIKNNQQYHLSQRILEALSKLSWQLPQQVLGVFLGQLTILLGARKALHHPSGVFLIQRKPFREKNRIYVFAGFTLGNIINYLGEAKGEYGESEIRKLIFDHELGHYEQSKRWGWLYLPCVALPSIVSATVDNLTKKSGDFHWKMPWEIGADKRAKLFWENPKNLLQTTIEK